MEAGTGPLTRPDCQLSPWGGRCPCPGSCPLAGGSPLCPSLWDAFDPGQWQLQRPFVTDLSARKSPRTHGGRDPAPRVRTRTEIISGIRMEMIPSEESGLRASCPRDTGGSTGGQPIPVRGRSSVIGTSCAGSSRHISIHPALIPRRCQGLDVGCSCAAAPSPARERGGSGERSRSAAAGPAQPGTARHSSSRA